MIGSGGNLSAREQGSDQCWITASGTWLDRLEPAEFSLIAIPQVPAAFLAAVGPDANGPA